MQNKEVLVIGGMNVDIGGIPGNTFIANDSNPGKISVTPGGVGRNIACYLKLLGIDVSMITAFGGDVFSNILMNNLKSFEIDYSMAVRAEKAQSSMYIYVTDEKAEMIAAVSDMQVVEMITPEVLRENIDRINGFDAVVIDANISDAAIDYLAENCRRPIYADTVSTAKAAKFKNYLSKFYCVKPNLIEASILTGKDNAKEALKELYKLGVKLPIVSAGKDGIYLYDGDEIINARIDVEKVVDVTGAGDAVMAAIVYGGVSGLDKKKTLNLAAKAGAMAVSAVGAVNQNIAEILK